MVDPQGNAAGLVDQRREPREVELYVVVDGYGGQLGDVVDQLLRPAGEAGVEAVPRVRVPQVAGERQHAHRAVGREADDGQRVGAGVEGAPVFAEVRGAVRSDEEDVRGAVERGDGDDVDPVD